MSLYFYACVFFLMRRRPPISTRMTHSFPTLRSSDLYTGDDALGFVLSLNLYRRQLSVAQRALIAAEVSSLKSADEEASITIEDAATIMGVSPRSISSACKVVRQGVPELLDAVKSGEISISEIGRAHV